MRGHADKIRETETRAAGEQPALRRGGMHAAFRIVDNRAEAVQLRELQQMAAGSPQAKSAARLQDMAANSPRMAAQRQQMRRMLGAPDQRREAPRENALQMKPLAAPLARQALDEEEALQGKTTTGVAPSQPVYDPTLGRRLPGRSGTREGLGGPSPQRAASPSDLAEGNDSIIQRMKLYHGTVLKDAKSLAKAGTTVTPTGKGELGGGFYMTHDMYQAARIADYYTATEERGTHWAVVEFDIPDKLLASMVKQIKAFPPGKEAAEYREEVKGRGNAVESPHDWSMSIIVDKQTPYPQHLFAQKGMLLLNHKGTTRKIVLGGQIGVDKDQYLDQVKGYNPEDDDVLNQLLGSLDEEEEEGEGVEEQEEGKEYEEGEEEEEEGFDTEYYDGRVKAAIEKDAPKLTKAVLKELEDDLREDYPGEYKRLMQMLIDNGLA